MFSTPTQEEINSLMRKLGNAKPPWSTETVQKGTKGRIKLTTHGADALTVLGALFTELGELTPGEFTALHAMAVRKFGKEAFGLED